jgi:hypothetical protein
VTDILVLLGCVLCAGGVFRCIFPVFQPPPGPLPRWLVRRILIDRQVRALRRQRQALIEAARLQAEAGRRFGPPEA